MRNSAFLAKKNIASLSLNTNFRNLVNVVDSSVWACFDGFSSTKIALFGHFSIVCEARSRFLEDFPDAIIHKPRVDSRYKGVTTVQPEKCAPCLQVR
jgi:hypothetical protein